jgi:hypothetical protein
MTVLDELKDYIANEWTYLVGSCSWRANVADQVETVGVKKYVSAGP